MSILVRDPLLARMACMFMRHGEKTKSMAIIEEAVVELRRRHGVERYVGGSLSGGDRGGSFPAWSDISSFVCYLRTRLFTERKASGR